jgi:hypothetical protein
MANSRSFFVGGEDDSSSTDEDVAVLLDRRNGWTDDRPLKLQKTASEMFVRPSHNFLIWSAVMDEILMESRALTDDWTKIASDVQQEAVVPLNEETCMERWQLLCKRSNPSSSSSAPDRYNLSISRLCELFIAHECSKGAPVSVNWDVIGCETHTSAVQAMRNWNVIVSRTANDIYRVGAFLPEEDRLILDFHCEWKRQGGGKGLYSALMKIMCRNDKRISERYRHKLCPRGGSSSENCDIETTPPPQSSSSSSSKAAEVFPMNSKQEKSAVESKALESLAAITVGMTAVTKWTGEMDAMLLEGYRLFGKSWSKVAEYVNLPDITNEKCRKRMSTLERRFA